MDPLSIIASAITIISTVSNIYESLKDIQGLPKAFKEVGQNLNLADETLKLARTQLESQNVSEPTKEAITTVLKDCERKATSLNRIFEEISKVEEGGKKAKDWAGLANLYRKIVLRLGKVHRVETLMQGILNGLKGLAIHKVFSTEHQEQVDKLERAIESLSKVEPSLNDSDFDKSSTQLNMEIASGGTGNQIFNETGNQTNRFGGYDFNTGGAPMHFAYHMQFTSKGYWNAITPESLKIFSPCFFEPKQHEAMSLAKNVPGTGSWLLKSNTFSDWKWGGLRKLWCPGIPGVGKTVLSSIIVDHLLSYCSGYAHKACIYVYFDHKQRDTQTLKSILAGILEQLSRKINIPPSEIEQNMEMGKDYLSEEHLLHVILTTIRSHFKEHGRVFMVIDALDECSDLHNFLGACKKMPPEVHMLVTSRPGDHFRNALKPDAEIEIIADAGDVRRFIQKSFSERSELQRMIDAEQRINPSFSERVFQTIVEKSQGMFLLAAHHEKCLASSYDIEQFERDLASLSNSPDEVYEVALDRINRQDKRLRDLATNVLVWLAFADRDLRTDELAHAISISNSTDKKRARPATLPTSSRNPTIETLIPPCAGLVVVDQDSKTIRLAHRTAEDYLRVQDSIYRLACANIARTCLLCLLHVPLTPSNNAKVSLEQMTEYKSDYPLISYAASHWGHHLRRGVHSSVKQLGWEFFSDSPRVDFATRFMVEYQSDLERNISGLHLAAYFGLTDLIKEAFSKNRHIVIDARTTRERTALHWAVKYRQHDFLTLLVQEGADPNIGDTEGRTALLSAIDAGDHRSVEILLSSKKHMDFQSADRERYTPLTMAAANGQTKLAKMLLDKGAEIDASDGNGWTALRCAADNGDISMVNMLLDRKASPNPPIMTIENQWTLLSWAASEGREQIIKRLADMRVDLDDQDSEGCTALHLAARYSHAMTAWLLIEAGASVNIPDNKGYRPLHEAMRTNTARTSASIVYLLSENRADLEAKTKFGCTPLHLAASQGNDSIVWFLIQKHVKCGKKDGKGHTALHSATGAGHAKVVHTLLWKHPNLVDRKDFSKRTPLHEAATYGQAHIAQMLLHGGASIDSQDLEGLTPLHIAVKQESVEVVKCLLDRKADANILSKKKQTASGLATEIGNKLIIEAIRRAEDERDHSHIAVE